MTAKDKAQELVNKIKDGLWKDRGVIIYYDDAMYCALIAVDEILEATKKYVSLRERVQYSKTGFDNVVHTQYDKFWKEVKQEINKL